MHSRGLSLVEVVAAIVLLAGTVTPLILSQSKASQQYATARNLTSASSLAQELTYRWRLEEINTSTPAQGVFEDTPNWSWQRTSSVYSNVGSITVLEVTLEIKLLSERDSQTVVSYSWLENAEHHK